MQSATFRLHVAGASVSDTSEIQVLSWAEAVRKRPAMYFGDVRDGTGLLHAVRLAFGGAMDQFIAGHANTIQVRVGEDGVVEIEDDGKGIPAFTRTGQSVSILEGAVTNWMTSQLAGGEIPFVVGAWNYGGAYGLVSAVSSLFEIESTYTGERTRLCCARGEVIERTPLGSSSTRGTRVRFLPDEAIFEGRVTPALVADLITETAWLHPRLSLVWQGEVLANEGGIEAWTRLRGKGELDDDFVFATSLQRGESTVDVALGWLHPAREGETLRAFVNSQPTSSEVVMPGVREGLRRVALDADSDRITLGLIGAVHVTQRDARAPVDALVADAIACALPGALEANPAARARFLARARGK
jgi:DNA gyrase/topoisomerase IV subunit B